MDRTKEMCTPRPRCRPAHVRQMKVPNLGEAHCGEGAEQSMQVVFPGRFCRAASCKDIDQKGIGLIKERGLPLSLFPGRLPTFCWMLYMQSGGLLVCYTSSIFLEGGRGN